MNNKLKKLTFIVTITLCAQAPMQAIWGWGNSPSTTDSKQSWTAWVLGGAAAVGALSYFGYRYLLRAPKKHKQAHNSSTIKNMERSPLTTATKTYADAETQTGLPNSPNIQNYALPSNPIKKNYVDAGTQTEEEREHTVSSMSQPSTQETPEQPAEMLEDVMDRIDAKNLDGNDCLHFRQAPVYINTHNVIINADNVNYKDSKERTALWLAAAMHHEALTKRLIDAQADVNDGCSRTARPGLGLPAYNQSPLAGALSNSDNFCNGRPKLPVVRLLVQAKASIPKIKGDHAQLTLMSGARLEPDILAFLNSNTKKE